MHENQVCAVVDAYSSGSQFAQIFAERGWNCIHVQSTSQVPRVFLPSFRPGDFLANIINSGIVDDILDPIRVYAPSCLIAGMETGVELADLLCERLGLAGNGTRCSSARRNKFDMQEQIRKHGLRSVRQMSSDDLPSIMSWIDDVGFPIIVKPLRSAGTDGVTLCHSAQEVARAVRLLLSNPDVYENANKEVLIQEFLTGTEYAVNTVSCRGHVYTTEIWKYQKRAANEGKFVYDISELLSPTGEIQDQLGAYVRQVLSAVEIVVGPAHTEVIITPRGPTLVEIGARVDGYANLQVSRQRGCRSQIELAVDSLVDPEMFFSRASKPYRYEKSCWHVSLISWRDGRVKAINLDAVKALPSFCDVRLKVAVGGRVTRTNDIASSPGVVTLVHEDPTIMKRDYLRIRELERDTILEMFPD